MLRTRRLLAAAAFLIGVVLGASVCGAGIPVPPPGPPKLLQANVPPAACPR